MRRASAPRAAAPPHRRRARRFWRTPPTSAHRSDFRGPAVESSRARLQVGAPVPNCETQTLRHPRRERRRFVTPDRLSAVNTRSPDVVVSWSYRSPRSNVPPERGESPRHHFLTLGPTTLGEGGHHDYEKDR